MNFLTKCVRFFQCKALAPKELTWLKSDLATHKYPEHIYKQEAVSKALCVP